jgi:hypothetical protein
MVGKINQLRAEVTKQATINHLPSAEIDKLDSQAKELLCKPEVIEAFDKAKMSEADVVPAIPVLLGEPSEVSVSVRTEFWGKFFSGMRSTFDSLRTIIVDGNARPAIPPAINAARDAM